MITTNLPLSATCIRLRLHKCNVNIAVFVSSTFDHFNQHFDAQNMCRTHFSNQVSITIDTMFNFDGHGNGDVRSKQTFSTWDTDI